MLSIDKVGTIYWIKCPWFWEIPTPRSWCSTAAQRIPGSGKVSWKAGWFYARDWGTVVLDPPPWAGVPPGPKPRSEHSLLSLQNKYKYQIIDHSPPFPFLPILRHQLEWRIRYSTFRLTRVLWTSSFDLLEKIV